MSSLDRCGNCGADVLNNISTQCYTCGNPIPPPNVREVNRPDEVAALEQRYNDAVTKSQADGTDDQLSRFEDDLHASHAVINVNLNFLKAFVTIPNVLYSTYGLQVNSEVRVSAELDNDRHRRGVEGTLFGSYDKEIRYAALSLDGSGLKSYGPYAIRLEDFAINLRATLMEENSFDFVETHTLLPGRPIPLGYRSSWENRHKLAVAKLASEITEDLSLGGQAALLLFSEGNYDTDSFIEVHIFGPFDAKAIAAVKGSSTPAKKEDRVNLQVVKDKLSNLGKDWVEA